MYITGAKSRILRRRRRITDKTIQEIRCAKVRLGGSDDLDRRRLGDGGGDGEEWELPGSRIWIDGSLSAWEIMAFPPPPSTPCVIIITSLHCDRWQTPIGLINPRRWRYCDVNGQVYLYIFIVHSCGGSVVDSITCTLICVLCSTSTILFFFFFFFLNNFFLRFFSFPFQL